MQKYCVYSVYDKVSGVFNRPVFDLNHGSAIRNFSQSIEEDRNKDDYVLYHIGTFDDSNGELIKEENPHKILTGLDVHIKEKDLPSLINDQAM
jgi:hypothetical protein